jgi:tRNA(adenine34) deaminase
MLQGVRLCGSGDMTPDRVGRVTIVRRNGSVVLRWRRNGSHCWERVGAWSEGGLDAAGLLRDHARAAEEGPKVKGPGCVLPGADERFMAEALEEAELARSEGEVPVGCVVVCGGRIVARAHNGREALRDPTAHAEMLALARAARALGGWRLEGATVYTTLEPCVMCAGALVLARVARLVYGAADPKAGAVESVFRILDEGRLNHRVRAEGGCLAARCGEALTDFFRARRAPCAARGPAAACAKEAI